uniref:Peptide deformylase n=1 Tax=Sphenodon punctatus TaxID=8508 RepID=A0A8D0GFK3_SPHPU
MASGWLGLLRPWKPGPGCWGLPTRCCSSSRLGERPRPYWKSLRRKVLQPPSPPYSKVCQVGDPVLRSAAAAVEPWRVTGAEVQALIRKLVRVMRKEDCVGLSAPQLGVPLQVFVAEFTKRQWQDNAPGLREAKQMAPFPLRVFVNPTMRVVESRLVTFPEGCMSICGFSACVPRYQAVHILGLNEAGEVTSWQASGWAARIVQHEMDHLQGIMYIDKMESRTFVNRLWEEVND